MKTTGSPAMDVERGFAKTSYGYIHYRAVGEGHPIALCSINQQSSDLMSELMLVLAGSMRAIAIDYPSHGMSDHIFFQPSIDDYVACVAETLDYLKIGEVSVLGEATGAAVAAGFASSYPQRTASCVLVSCPYVPPGVEWAREAGVTPESRPSDPTGFPVTRTIDYVLSVDPLHAPMKPTQAWMDRINRAQIEAGRERWQAITALRNYDLGSALSRVACPALMVSGDQFYFVRYLDEAVGRLREGQARVLKDGRFCLAWERADEIGMEVASFVHKALGL